MSAPDQHTAALEHLLAFDLPIEDLRRTVLRLPWDCDAALVVLTRAHVDAVLRRHLAGTLEAEGVEAWANLIECREDIDFDPGTSVEIAAIIHELANPLLVEPLTADRARRMPLAPGA